MLALAQTLLMLHDVEHLGHSDEEQCETCLIGAPLGAALATATPPISADVDPPLLLANALNRPNLQAPFNPHPARAPPHAAPH